MCWSATDKPGPGRVSRSAVSGTTGRYSLAIPRIFLAHSADHRVVYLAHYFPHQSQHRGIVLRLLSDMFAVKANRRKTNDIRYRLSFVELRGKNVIDLLTARKPKAVNVNVSDVFEVSSHFDVKTAQWRRSQTRRKSVQYDSRISPRQTQRANLKPWGDCSRGKQGDRPWRARRIQCRTWLLPWSHFTCQTSAWSCRRPS